MTQTQHPEEGKTINLFFGQRHQDTLKEFDDLSKDLRRSRTGTLHFLLTHYRWYERHKMISLWWVTVINRPIIQERVDFLQSQIQSLDHYLPETYQLLMRELDIQQRNLMAIKIKTFYSSQDHVQ